MKVEYDNLTPLYDQVKRSLLGDLKTGRYPTGTYLPSETELCAHYAVSRITLRRAVSELCSEGYLRKVHGRGTLVLKPKLKQTLVSLGGFTESLASLGHEVRYTVLDSGVRPELESVKELLEAKPADRIMAIRRLLIVDGHPLTLESLYFLQDRYGLVSESVTQGGSFYEALRTHYNEQPTGAERTINVGFPSAAECELLACTASEPVYRIEKLVLGRKRRPISFSIIVTPAERVTYSINV